MKSQCQTCGVSPILDLDGAIQFAKQCWKCKIGEVEGKPIKKSKPHYKLTEEAKKDIKRSRRGSYEQFLTRIGINI